MICFFIKGSEMSEINNVATESSQIPNEKFWSSLTATIFSIIGVMWAITFLGLISIDFSIFFFVLSVITGFYRYREKKVWHKFLHKDSAGTIEKPWWLSWSSDIFPIVVVLFLVRGFIAEPFKIPTGSMIPTIMVGDISIINKFYYDVKIPIIEKSIYSNHEVKHGDIVVFRFPPNPSVYYIKRFVGLPGDVMNYNFDTKTLLINNQVISKHFEKSIISEGTPHNLYEENLFGVKHALLEDPEVKGLVVPEKVNVNTKACRYTLSDLTCTIPKDYYFAMGDNRDNSLDSRYWGFVPKDNVVGKASIIAFSTSGFSHFGTMK